MRAFKLFVVGFFLFGFALAGCSFQQASVPSSDTTTTETSDSSSPESSTTGSSTTIQESVSTTSASDPISSKKQEVRDRIMKQRQEADASRAPSQLASTGVGMDVALAAAVFFALVYVGVRRRVWGKIGE